MDHLLTETSLEHYNAAALEQLLAALPASWRARAERYKPLDARLRSALGYTLLARLLREQFGIAELPSIAADEHGKPYLVDCPLHFSISHCKAAVACIVDERPVGLDVQDILTDVSPALAARIAAPLSPDGLTTDGRKPKDLSPRDLTILWTQKEASAKLDGRGLRIGLENLPIKGHKVEIKKHDHFVMSIAR